MVTENDQDPAPGPVPVLSLTGAARPCGPVVALVDGIIEIRAGEVHALVSEDDAGKSTIGISVIDQGPTPFPDLTVSANIFIGRQPKGALGPLDRARRRQDARDLFAQLSVPIDPYGTCSVQLAIGNTTSRVNFGRPGCLG